MIKFEVGKTYATKGALYTVISRKDNRITFQCACPVIGNTGVTNCEIIESFDVNEEVAHPNNGMIINRTVRASDEV